MAKKTQRAKTKPKKAQKKVQRKTISRVKKRLPAKPSLKAKQVTSAPEGVAKTKIRVIGIGGGGSSIVGEIARSIGKVDFVCANTDSQALANSAARTVIQLGHQYSVNYKILFFLLFELPAHCMKTIRPM
mgnify:CR=1 FL=1